MSLKTYQEHLNNKRKDTDLHELKRELLRLETQLKRLMENGNNMSTRQVKQRIIQVTQEIQDLTT